MGKAGVIKKKPILADGLVRQIVDVLDALPCGALLVDRDGRIVYANPRLAVMGRRTAEEIVGQELRSLYPAADEREQIERFLQDFDAVHDTEFFLPLPDGQHLPVVAAGCPLRTESGRAEYRVVTMIDVSPLKEAERRTREQYTDIARLSDTVLEQALDLKHQAKTLEKRVRQRTRELHEANMDAIYMLAVASEAKDEDTGAHVLRIRDYSAALARMISFHETEAERVGDSAILHDVGKIQVPDDILKKPGPLTPAERQTIQRHAEAGERILSDKPFFDTARQIARSHHENWDGSGYPDGARDTDIPLAARIVRLADVFDALVSPRIYKSAWPLQRVVETIKDGSEKLFDPDLVQAFLKLLESGEWLEIGKHESKASHPARER